MSPNTAQYFSIDRSMGAGYPVSLDAFDGPLDLLLQLIERQELDISEISLCAVTDQYLETLDQVADVEPAALADFLAVASRLLYIKSNRILPRPADDEAEEEDAGDALVRQLIEYRRFRQVADSLKSRADSGHRVHVRPVAKKTAETGVSAPPDLSDVELDDLQQVLLSVLQRMPVEPPAPSVRPYEVTLSEQIGRVRDFVRKAQRSVRGSRRSRVLFSAVLGSAYTRTEVIVTFLAILELIKQQELTVQQDATFAEIYLIPLDLVETSVAVPKS